MPTLSANMIVKMRVVSFIGDAQVSGQSGINVRHYRVSQTTGLSSSLTNFLDTMNIALGPLYKAILSSAAQYRGVGVQVIWPPNEFSLEETTVISVGNGLVIGQMLPPQSSGILRFGTLKGGRKHRGFMYLPFPGGDDNLGGVPSAGYVTRSEQLGNALRQAITIGAAGDTAILTPVIYHRDDGTTTDIANVRGKDRWSQQKRRSTMRPGELPPF